MTFYKFGNLCYQLLRKNIFQWRWNRAASSRSNKNCPLFIIGNNQEFCRIIIAPNLSKHFNSYGSASLPNSFYKALYLNTYLYNHFIQRGCFFSLHYCSLELWGPDFQNGAEHLREIRMPLNCRVSGVFLVFATQAKVTSEATWSPKCRWLAAGDRKIYMQFSMEIEKYIQFDMFGLCIVSLLLCNIWNVYLGPVFFLFSFFFLTP